jgi:hypothetical protein
MWDGGVVDTSLRRRRRQPSGSRFTSRSPMTIDLRHPLTLRNSFRFPLQSEASRRDLFSGGLWLLGIGHPMAPARQAHP